MASERPGGGDGGAMVLSPYAAPMPMQLAGGGAGGAPPRRQYNGTVGQYRPLGGQLRQYVDALGGPSDRAHLVYTGDPQASLDSLHADVVSHYRQLSAALGEHERHDLINHPPPLAGMSFGRLSLAAGPSPPLLLGGPSASSSSSSPYLPSPLPLALPSSSFLQSPPNYAAALRPGGGGASSLGGLGFGGGGGGGGSGFAGIRPSNFATYMPQPEEGSLMSNEASQLLFPPVGSTFEGRPSRAVEAVRRGGGIGIGGVGGIDSMADLQYRRASQPLVFEDVVRSAGGTGGGGPASAVSAVPAPSGGFRSGSGGRDQLDSFLSDFASGRAQASQVPGGVGGGGMQLAVARPYKPQYAYAT